MLNQSTHFEGGELGLFRTIGPKHTRLCAQIVAAVIGASFVIGRQLAAILSYRYAPDSGSTLWLPARAILGDMPALMVVFSISAIMLTVTICIFHAEQVAARLVAARIWGCLRTRR